MRNTNAQRVDIMIRVSGSQQPSKSHVRHAEIGGRFIRSNAAGDRCAVWRTGEQAVQESKSAAVPDLKILPNPRLG